MIKNWNFLFSMITAIVAICALRQTNKQIKISNKQHLFDKRMENYLIAMGLIQLFRSNRMNFDSKKDEPMFAADLDFVWLTNNAYLEQITPAIRNPLKEPSHKELLIKLEDLKHVATSIRILFPDKVCGLLGDFVFSYQELLFSLYQYKIILDKMKIINEDHKLTLKEIQKEVGEEEYRIKLNNAFDNLDQVDILLKNKNVQEKIEKQIKLY